MPIEVVKEYKYKVCVFEPCILINYPETAAEEYVRLKMCEREFGHYPSTTEEWQYYNDCQHTALGERFLGFVLNELRRCTGQLPTAKAVGLSRHSRQ